MFTSTLTYVFSTHTTGQTGLNKCLRKIYTVNAVPWTTSKKCSMVPT